MSIAKKFKTAAIAAVLAWSFPLAATAADDTPGAWLIVSSSEHFSRDSNTESRWRYWVDAQYRYFDRDSDLRQYLLRPGIGYDINNNVSIWFGYAYVTADLPGANDVNEQRIWQQLSWNVSNWGARRLSLRARLEERWRNTGDDIAATLRLQLKYSMPVGSREGYEVVLAAETFFDLRDTDWGADNGLSQMRSSVGVATTIREHWRLEVGYLNQYVLRNKAPDGNNHLAYLSIRFKP